MKPKSYYASIADDVAANADADYQSAFARMADESVQATVDISVDDIKRYLILMDRWLTLKKAAAAVDPVQYKESADIAIDTLSVFDIFRLSEPSAGAAISAKLGAMMDALIVDGLIDANDKAAILGMGMESNPKWRGLREGEVQNAIDWRQEGVI